MQSSSCSLMKITQMWLLKIAKVWLQTNPLYETQPTPVQDPVYISYRWYVASHFRDSATQALVWLDYLLLDVVSAATECFRSILGDWCTQNMRSMWHDQSSVQKKILRGRNTQWVSLTWTCVQELMSAVKQCEGASNCHTLVSPILCWI